MTRRTFLAALAPAAQSPPPPMHWADSSRGRPFSKDPSVITFGGRYLLYYSLAPAVERPAGDGWAIGIAGSPDLRQWTKVAEVLPDSSAPYETKGICAPCARVIDGKVHIFYQTYGNGAKDAICHAVSADGLRFERDPSNPVFHPTGDWTSGRAIDADVFPFKGRWYLYAATRDPAMKIQLLTGAVAEQGAGFGRDAWKLLAARPLLKPELPWEQLCIEAPTVVERDGTLVMFYAGAYNNAPQQIGVAFSKDAVNWSRMSPQPFLAVGAPGSWNSSESGHPGVFTDTDGSTYLFFQGNNDNGKTWYLSFERIGWKGSTPYLLAR